MQYAVPIHLCLIMEACTHLQRTSKPIYIVTSASNFNRIVCLIVVSIAPRAPVGVNKSYAFLNTKAHFDINIEAYIHNFRVLL